MEIRLALRSCMDFHTNRLLAESHGSYCESFRWLSPSGLWLIFYRTFQCEAVSTSPQGPACSPGSLRPLMGQVLGLCQLMAFSKKIGVHLFWPKSSTSGSGRLLSRYRRRLLQAEICGSPIWDGNFIMSDHVYCMCVGCTGYFKGFSLYDL